MKQMLCVCLLGAVLVACEPALSPPQSDHASYTVDAKRLTVSGVSAGAYMAGQLHVAHSALIGGAALLAGGPYWCAENSLSKGLGPCMKGGDTGLDRLRAYAQQQAADGRIDDLANLADDRVWVFHGSNDAVVHADASVAGAAFYKPWVGADHITYVDSIAVTHGFPTLAEGAACDEFKSPYLNACDYDAAGMLLAALYGELQARGVATGELRQVAQPEAASAEMLENAFLYVPPACAAGASCGVHVAFHGCLQSAAFVGDKFARHAGYNEWADSNKLLVLYPQVASSTMAPLNPNGCWDWWGYTNEDYATQQGAQIAVVKATLDALAGTTL